MSSPQPPYPGSEGNNPPSALQLDPREYARIFRRRWWIAVLAIAACLGASIAITAGQTKQYEGRARLFVGRQAAAREELALPLVQTSLALVRSYAEAIKTRPIADEVRRDLDLQQSSDSLLGRLRAEGVLDTQIIDLSYRDPDPSTAQSVTNAFAETFVDSVKEIDPAGGSGVSVNILEPAVFPRSPVSPQPIRNLALAGVLGSLLALGSVLLVERFDASVRSREDVELVSGLPVLALVPHVKTRSLLQLNSTAAAESYRTLRSALKYVVDRQQANVVAVTSPDAKDGKTTTAYNLAVALAEVGVHAVYVEADLRRPTLTSQLDFSGGTTLSEFLSGGGSADGLVRRTDLPSLHLVLAGGAVDNPAELLGSERMEKLIAGLSANGELVILDTPPVLAVSDPIELTPFVDGTLIVVRSGRTRREHLRETIRVLRGVGANVLGLIVNDVSPNQGYYSYYRYPGY